VFARVLVEDVACDRHVLIGTNTHGLLGYIHESLDSFLAGQRVVTPEDLSAGTEEGLPARRLDALLARLRIVPRTPEALAGQFEIFARGAGRLLPTAALAEAAERCALAVPPGVDVTVMGTQNIKGTGLDFVYRWIALDVAMQDLASLASTDAETRAAALRRLESPDDPGLIDAGLVAARLNARAPEPGEVELQTRARTAVAARHEARRAALGQRKKRGRGERFAAWAEGWVDFLDGARRHGRAKQGDARPDRPEDLPRPRGPGDA
jgi:hypothetical protein